MPHFRGAQCTTKPAFCNHHHHHFILSQKQPCFLQCTSTPFLSLLAYLIRSQLVDEYGDQTVAVGTSAVITQKAGTGDETMTLVRARTHVCVCVCVGSLVCVCVCVFSLPRVTMGRPSTGATEIRPPYPMFFLCALYSAALCSIWRASKRRTQRSRSMSSTRWVLHAR